MEAAVGNYVRERTRHYARKAINKLQRMPETGAHPYGWDMRTFWSLYSWEVQNGPSDNYEFMEDMVKDVAEGVLSKASATERDLMLLYLDPEDEARDHVLLDAVVAEVSSLARARDLERYDPDYRWYENL